MSVTGAMMLSLQAIVILTVEIWPGMILWILAQIHSRTINLRVNDPSEIEGKEIIAHNARGQDLI